MSQVLKKSLSSSNSIKIFEHISFSYATSMSLHSSLNKAH